MENELLLKTERFQVVRRTQTMPSGETFRRAVIQHPGSVVIVPVVDHDHICLVDNFRVSINARLLEIPAGTLEAGEDPLACAYRELAEETGYRAASMELVLTLYPSPGILDELMHIYVAEDLQTGEMDLDAGEDIRTVILSWEEILERIRRGEIHDAKTVAAVLYCHAFRQGSVT
jgi:ADP-ribose pyrophosphatase